MDLSVGGEFFSGRRVLGVTEHCCQGAAPVHGQTLRIIVWTSSSSLSSSSSSRSSSYNGVASLARAQWSDCGLMSSPYTQPAPHNCCTTSIFFSTRCRWWGYTIIHNQPQPHYTQPTLHKLPLFNKMVGMRWLWRTSIEKRKSIKIIMVTQIISKESIFLKSFLTREKVGKEGWYRKLRWEPSHRWPNYELAE